MADYIRLSAAPRWCIQYPTCSACAIDLYTEGDGWLCQSCGTQWDMRAGDGDAGTLYSEWAGEESDGPLVAEDDAYLWGDYHQRLERHRVLPEFCPKPERPSPPRSRPLIQSKAV